MLHPRKCWPGRSHVTLLKELIEFLICFGAIDIWPLRGLQHRPSSHQPHNRYRVPDQLNVLRR